MAWAARRLWILGRDLQGCRLIRFLMVGGVNTVFGYSIFAGVYLTTGGQKLAVTASIVLGVLFNFVTTGRLVFNSRELGKLPRFVVAYGLALGLNLALIEVFLRIGINAFLAQALCLPAVVITAYIVNARWVFRSPA